MDRELGIGTGNWEQFVELDAQRIIFNLSLFSFLFSFEFFFVAFRFIRPAPLSPPCSGNMVLLHVARSPPSHSLCMSFA